MNRDDLRSMIRAYWRVPIIALVAGALAFMGSYALSPRYAASTRLLVRARDTTFLTTTGQNLTNQPGVVDSSLATALADTQSALLDSRTVATMVVDKLHLDVAPAPVKHGPIGSVLQGLKNAKTKIMAFAVHGMYKVSNPHDAAVDQVYGSLVAKQLTNSYVIELTASAATPVLSQQIADTAADALVTVSLQRFQDEAAAYRDYLKGQLDTATKQESAAAQAVADYDKAHNITQGSTADILSQTSADALQQQLTSANANLKGAQAALTSLQASLSSVNPTDSSTTNVTTGRSQTAIAQSNPSSSYEGLVQAVKEAAANVASLQAQRDSIAAALNPASGGSPTTLDPALGSLNTALNNATTQVTTLSSQYSTAVVNAGTNTVDVTRLDKADLPTYPYKPVRMLYLILGAFFGGLAGFFLSYFKRARRPAPVLAEDAETALVPRRRPGGSFLPPTVRLPEGMATPQTVSFVFTGTLSPDGEAPAPPAEPARPTRKARPASRGPGRHSLPGPDWQVWEESAPGAPSTREV